MAKKKRMTGPSRVEPTRPKEPAPRPSEGATGYTMPGHRARSLTWFRSAHEMLTAEGGPVKGTDGYRLGRSVVVGEHGVTRITAYPHGVEVERDGGECLLITEGTGGWKL